MRAMWVTDRSSVGDERFDELLRALRGAEGLSVQIREKTSLDREALGWIRRARTVLGPAVRISVNRRFDLAIAGGADGVHLPADGIPPARVRPMLPRGLSVGISTHSARQARACIESGADVVVLGPIFATPSKAGLGCPLGVDAIRELPDLSSHSSEVFAIGGISEEKLSELDDVRDRISGVAAIRMFQNARDPRAAVERIGAR